jgi:predicted ATPase
MLYRLKYEGFPVSRSHSEVDFFSYLEESLRLIKVNLEWIDDANSKKPKFELSSIMQYVLDDFLKNDILERLKRFELGFQSISSLSSVRANSERLYSNDSDIVDINSLLIDFSRITFKMNDPIEDFVDRSLQLFSIGEKINIKRHQGKATEVYAKRDGEDVLLADLGFGFTQLVPIILKIAVAAYRKQAEQFEVPFLSSLFLLEEPESNLHPSYQSKLAELIIDAANTFDIQFIIETHSEYMIRNFQYLTATKQIPSNGTKIYYFNQPDSEDFKEAPYREIEILNDGRLSKSFGSGFFDEADKIVFELYRLSVNNN